VRLPRRLLSAALIVNEQRWLPELAAGLPLPVPAPLRLGRPGCGYPWAWSVGSWLPGIDIEHTSPTDWHDVAQRLGRPGPIRPRGWGRGPSLSDGWCPEPRQGTGANCP
jgi:aminoglycoside phosphotransferase (APT) family kinase protein